MSKHLKCSSECVEDCASKYETMDEKATCLTFCACYDVSAETPKVESAQALYVAKPKVLTAMDLQVQNNNAAIGATAILSVVFLVACGGIYLAIRSIKKL